MQMSVRALATLCALGILVALATPAPALAYVGPGLGMAAIASFLAIVAAVLLAIAGFIWYPVKRLIRALKNARKTD